MSWRTWCCIADGGLLLLFVLPEEGTADALLLLSPFLPELLWVSFFLSSSRGNMSKSDATLVMTSKAPENEEEDIGDTFVSENKEKELDRNSLTSINLSIHRSNHPSIHQSIDQSIDPSVNPSIHRFIDHLIDPSIHLSTMQSIYPLINLSIDHSIDWSINQCIDQSIHPSICPLVPHFVIFIVNKLIS